MAVNEWRSTNAIMERIFMSHSSGANTSITHAGSRTVSGLSESTIAWKQQSGKLWAIFLGWQKRKESPLITISYGGSGDRSSSPVGRL